MKVEYDRGMNTTYIKFMNYRIKKNKTSNKNTYINI
jgi:hypothetical protein